MSDFGLFEADAVAQAEPARRARLAANQLTAAIGDVRRSYGPFLFGSTGLDEFEDRWHYSKRDIRRTVEPHLLPVTGVMRRIHGALRREFKVRLADNEDGTVTKELESFPLNTGPVMPGATPGTFTHEGTRHRADISKEHDNPTVDPKDDDDRDITINEKQRRKIKKGEQPGDESVETNTGDGSDSSGDIDDDTADRDSGQGEKGKKDSKGKKESFRKGAPFADYADWEDCIRKNSGKDSPEKYCGYIRHRTEDKKSHRIACECEDKPEHQKCKSCRESARRTASLEQTLSVPDRTAAFAELRRLATVPSYEEWAAQEKANGYRPTPQGYAQAVGDEGHRHFTEYEDWGEDPWAYKRGGLGDAPDQHLDQTYVHEDSEPDLVPGGNFDAYLDNVDQGGPEKVQRDFGSGGDTGSDRHAARMVVDLYTDWARSNGLRVANLDTLEIYASNISDREFAILDAAIRNTRGRRAERLFWAGEEDDDDDPDIEIIEEGKDDRDKDDDEDSDDSEDHDSDDDEDSDDEESDDSDEESDSDSDDDDEDDSDEDSDDDSDDSGDEPQGGRYWGPDAPDEDEDRRDPGFGGWPVARRRHAAEDDDRDSDSGGGGQQGPPPQQQPPAQPQDPAAGPPQGPPQPVGPPAGLQVGGPAAPPAPVENQPAEDALLDVADQAVQQMIQRETQEYQQIIDPLNQALQAIEFAKQVEQQENPLDVTPPQGTVDVTPGGGPQQMMGGRHESPQAMSDEDHYLAWARHHGMDPDKLSTADRWGQSFDDRGQHAASRQQRMAARFTSAYGMSDETYQMVLAAMSRKHYQQVADAISQLPPQHRPQIAASLADMFKADNPRFQHQPFFASAGVAMRHQALSDDIGLGSGNDGLGNVSGLPDTAGSNFGGATDMSGAPTVGVDSGTQSAPGAGTTRTTSRGRHPFVVDSRLRGGGRPQRTAAGETWTPMESLDAFEFPNKGTQKPDDNMPMTDLKPVKKGRRHEGKGILDLWDSWSKGRSESGQSRGPVADFEAFTDEKQPGPKQQQTLKTNLGLDHEGSYRHAVDTVAPPDPGSWAAEGSPNAPGPAQWANIDRNVTDPAYPIPDRIDGGTDTARPNGVYEGSRRQASFFTRRVSGWDWDDHLNGYLASAPNTFTCHCGSQFDTPSYYTCRCGKVWNSYVIGQGGDHRTAQVDMYICREVPQGVGIVMANKTAEVAPDVDIHQGWTPLEDEPGWQHPDGGVIRKDVQKPDLWQLWGKTVTFGNKPPGWAMIKQPVEDPRELMDWWAWTGGEGPKPKGVGFFGSTHHADQYAGPGDSFPIGTEKDLHDAKSVCNFPSVHSKHPGTCDNIEKRQSPKTSAYDETPHILSDDEIAEWLRDKKQLRRQRIMDQRQQWEKGTGGGYDNDRIVAAIGEDDHTVEYQDGDRYCSACGALLWDPNVHHCPAKQTASRQADYDWGRGGYDQQSDPLKGAPRTDRPEKGRRHPTTPVRGPAYDEAWLRHQRNLAEQLRRKGYPEEDVQERLEEIPYQLQPTGSRHTADWEIYDDDVDYGGPKRPPSTHVNQPAADWARRDLATQQWLPPMFSPRSPVG